MRGQASIQTTHSVLVAAEGGVREVFDDGDGLGVGSGFVEFGIGQVEDGVVQGCPEDLKIILLSIVA
jgi:hypothetical protein